MKNSPITAEEELKAYADARKLIAIPRLEFAGNNHPVWLKLHHADEYISDQQARIMKEALGDENSASGFFRRWLKWR
jgi:hypothetical protein